MENLEKILNKEQLEAVRYTEGPLLVLAGAGSGKTRVLTHRVAYLIENCEVRPWNILAITFTNKAAGEMRERVDKLIGARAREVWVSTFHSMCVRILRQHIEGLGYTSDFSIYDTDDQKTVMKQIFKELNIDTHELRERGVLSVISSAKNRGTDPSDFRKEIGGDYRERKIADCYELYEKKLRQNNALDFDDLLLRTIELFKTNEEVLEYYQNRFRYIMVDEYQDTNDIQFMLVQQLAGKYQNLCVVGDDDQSIYKFRGANVSIILNFEKYYPKAKVVKLEQNYRSTEKILNCANAVIANNAGRKPKKLWTAKAGGADVRFQEFENANDEAYAVIREVRDCGRSYQDQAILYRTNAQSRLLEEQCIKMNIPYQIVGGVNFYQRKEIKDILAYLKVIANGADNVAFTRIINVPKRGIGPGTVQKLTDYAAMHDGSLFGAAAKAVTNGIVAGKAGKELQKFCDMIEQYRVKLIDSGLLPAPDSNIKQTGDYSIRALIESIRDDTGYAAELQADGQVEAETRLQNIEEMINKAVSYEAEAETPHLGEFLEEVSLVSDLDRTDDTKDLLTMMTLHGAKGLEFPKVYLVGMNDGLFPGYMSQNDPEDLEEERRLCYVGITRAREELVMTAARSRMVNGNYERMKPSQFIDEIPDDYMDKTFLYGGRNSDAGDFDMRYGEFRRTLEGETPFGGAMSSQKAGSGYPGFGKDFSTLTPYEKRGAFGHNKPLVFDHSDEVKGRANQHYDERDEYASDEDGSRYGERNDVNSYGLHGMGSTGYKNPTLPSGLRGSLDKALGIRHKKGSGIPDALKAPGVQKLSKLDYEEGDRVSHIKFGQGTVIKIEDDKKDFKVTVDFDKSGRKTMFASFARLKKI